MARTAYVVKVLSKHGPIRCNDKGRYWVQHDGHVISVIDQAGEALCIRVRHVTDVDDLLTDYFAGVYAKNIKQAVTIAGWA